MNKMKKQLDKQRKCNILNRNVIFFILASIVCSLSLLNSFKIPYIGDDEINSLTKGAMEYYDRSLFDHTWQIAKIWMQSGRFLPLSFYSYSVFVLFPDLLSYRLFLFVLNLGAIAVFAGFIHQMTKKWEAACISMIAVAVFFQYRDYHDAILAYHGMLQFVSILFFASLILQFKALEKKRIQYSVISGIFFLSNLLLYEITYAFIIVYLLLFIFYRKRKNVFKLFIPHIIALSISGMLTIIVRQLAVNVSYNGISFSFHPEIVVQTFIKQFTAVFPLNYLHIIYEQISLPFWKHLAPYHFTSFIIFFFLILYCSFHFIKKQKKRDKDSTALFRIPNLPEKLLKKEKQIERCDKAKNDALYPADRHSWEKILFFIGVALCVVPAGIVSLSSRYQQELRTGEGYLPVYIQYFGAVCCTTALFFLLLRWIEKFSIKIIFCIVTAVCSTCILFFTTAVNQVVVDIIVGNSVQPVSNHATEVGIFDAISDRDRVFVIQGGLAPEVEAESYICLYADGLKVGPVKMNHLLDELGKGIENGDGSLKLYPENIYGFYASGTLKDGFAAIFPIEEFDYLPDVNYVTQIYTKEMQFIYIGQGDGKKMYIPRLSRDGEYTGVFADVFIPDENNVFASLTQENSEPFLVNEDAGNGLTVRRAEKIVEAPEGIKAWFLLDRGDTYSFFVRSNQFPIIVRNITFVEDEM